MWYLLYALPLIVLLPAAIKIIPQQEAWIVERFGKYRRTLEAGMHFIIPFADRIAYRHSLKEVAIDVHEQTAITKDNVSVKIDGMLYIKIFDPKGASYGVFNLRYALTQLAQTTLRSEIGKIHLDRTFEEREHLNVQVLRVLNQAAQSWGIECLRYEVKDITMPEEIRRAMELQMTAERQKRARILESEGKRQSDINEAEGRRQSRILESEGEKQRRFNEAEAESKNLQLVAAATRDALLMLAEAMQSEGGQDAVNFKVAERYLEAFKELAKESTTLLLPSDISDPRSFIAQISTILGNKVNVLGQK
ncbi:MAG: stomatin 2 [Chlamydiae bacterium RIFCSPHIGHO2_12_FULL_49_11]|nr:MAG: stomatin 2 [Chlamydiae bacterium RIFCSPHIGHO2_12_FULL_49_11]